jgi:hypothetical protein
LRCLKFRQPTHQNNSYLIVTRTYIRTIDEAKQVEHGNGRANHQINLPPQLTFRYWVELEERLAISRWLRVSRVFSEQFIWNVLISRNLTSCSCIVCYFIGVLLLGEAVFAVHGSHRCNDTPVIGVCLAFVKFQPVGGLSGRDTQTLSRIDK